MERSAWTDERLDDLATALRADIRGLREEVQGSEASLRAEIKAGEASLRAEIKAGEASLRAEIGALRADFTAWQRQIAQIGWALVGTLIAALVALVIASL